MFCVFNVSHIYWNHVWFLYHMGNYHSATNWRRLWILTLPLTRRLSPISFGPNIALNEVASATENLNVCLMNLNIPCKLRQCHTADGLGWLTHWDLNKMAKILQNIFKIAETPENRVSSSYNANVVVIGSTGDCRYDTYGATGNGNYVITVCLQWSDAPVTITCRVLPAMSIYVENSLSYMSRVTLFWCWPLTLDIETFLFISSSQTLYYSQDCWH